MNRKLAKAFARLARAHDLRKTFEGYREASYTSFPATRDYTHTLPNGRNSSEKAKTIMENTPRVFFSRDEIVQSLKEQKIDIINLVNRMERDIADKVYEVGSPKHLAVRTKIDDIKGFIRSMKLRYSIEEGELKVHDLLVERERERELTELRQLRDAVDVLGSERLPEGET